MSDDNVTVELAKLGLTPAEAESLMEAAIKAIAACDDLEAFIAENYPEETA